MGTARQRELFGFQHGKPSSGPQGVDHGSVRAGAGAPHSDQPHVPGTAARFLALLSSGLEESSGRTCPVCQGMVVGSLERPEPLPPRTPEPWASEEASLAGDPWACKKKYLFITYIVQGRNTNWIIVCFSKLYLRVFQKFLILSHRQE